MAGRCRQTGGARPRYPHRVNSTAETAPPARTLAAQYAALRARRAAGRGVDFEALLRVFYRGLLKPGDIAFDIGAHQGGHTIPMAEAIRGPGAALHAFEGNPAMAAALADRLAARGFGFAAVHALAVGAEDGEAEFVVALDSPGYSGLREREYDQPDMRTERVRVRVARLDSIFATLPRLAYMKIDIEGGEFDALRGAAGLVGRLRPAISFEFGRRSYGAYGVDPGTVFDWFAGRGYLLFDVIGNRLAQRERFLRADAIPGVWDFLAVPEERGELKRLAQAQARLMEWG